MSEINPTGQASYPGAVQSIVDFVEAQLDPAEAEQQVEEAVEEAVEHLRGKIYRCLYNLLCRLVRMTERQR